MSLLDVRSENVLPSLTATRFSGNSAPSSISHLLSAAPGISVLSQLIEIDPFALGKGERVDFLEALERQTSWLNAIVQRAIVAVAGNG